MPRVTVHLNGADCHCSPSQVGAVLAQMQESMGTEGAGQCSKAFAARSLAAFVEETHLFIADQMDESALPDLRHCVLLLRRCLLQHRQPSELRKQQLKTLDFLLRLHIANCELRHFSRGKLSQAAMIVQELTQDLASEAKLMKPSASGRSLDATLLIRGTATVPLAVAALMWECGMCVARVHESPVCGCVLCLVSMKYVRP